MFKDNRIVFGYGTVLLTSNQIRKSVLLEYIEPPKTIGMKLKEQDLEDVVVIEKILFDYGKDMKTLLKHLDDVNKDNTIIEFRDYILDFTNYNPESVSSVRRTFKDAIQGWMLGYAC